MVQNTEYPLSDLKESNRSRNNAAIIQFVLSGVASAILFGPIFLMAHVHSQQH